MIAQDIPAMIRERVCAEIQVKDTGNRLAIALPLTFGDGDTCRLYVTPEADGTYTVTDGGLVLATAFSEGVDLLSEGYSERIANLMELHGASERARELRTTVRVSDLGDAIFSMTQACLEIAKLSEVPPELAPKRRAFAQRFNRVVERTVPSAVKGWRDETRDPKKIYLIDYGTPDGSWLINGAGSLAKSWKSAAAIQHYRLTELDFKSVFAYTESVGSNPKAIEVLADNSDFRFSLDTERPRFRAFLRRNVART